MTILARRCLALLGCLCMLILPLQADGTPEDSASGGESFRDIQAAGRAPDAGSARGEPVLSAEVSCDSPLDFVEIFFDLDIAAADGRPGGGDEIASIDVCVDYPDDRLRIDCADKDADGTPDDVRFLIEPGFSASATCQSQFPGCRLKLSFDGMASGRPLPGGRLASASFALEGGTGRNETVQVQLQSSSALDSLGNGVVLETKNRAFAVDECCAADCNGDLIIDMVDAFSVMREMSEGRQYGICGEGSQADRVGRSCCDCNADRRVDLADAVCVARGIGKLGCPETGSQLARTAIVPPGSDASTLVMPTEASATLPSIPEEGSPLFGYGNTMPLTSGVQGPVLSLGADVPAGRGQRAIMPVFFAQGGDDGAPGGPDDTTAFAVCLDFDPADLDFNPADLDGDGSPDNVVFRLGPQFIAGAQFDVNRGDCELLLTVIDLIPPLAMLEDGLTVEIAFDVTTSAQDEITVGCGDPTLLSFSDTIGNSLAGACFGGSFKIAECRDEDCDDGNPCNGIETCSSKNECQVGTPLVCDDGVDCTTDSCDPNGVGCVFEAVDAACDDNQFCNGIETCDPTGGCQAGTPPVCDDGVGCTVDGCDSDADGGAGACAAAADDAACDDGQFCNGVETCDLTNDCQAGEPAVCDDGVECTLDTCDDATGVCVSEPDDAFCDDGQFCNGIETCDPTGGCQAGTPPVCDDGVGCTVDSCDSDADGGAGACAAATDDAACDDGQFCNGAETCDLTNDCQAGEAPVCDDGVGCTVDSCDSDADGGAGACAAAADDAACDDGQFCNGVETCDLANDCQAGEPPVCDDGVECTLDTCDDATGACVSEPDDAFCDDGQFCNGIETCDPTGGCQAGTPPVCDDGVGCTVDGCDSDADGGAGACAAATDDAACDDGQFCNGVETCDPTNDCQAGEPPVCDDGVECTLDTCDDATGACVSEPDDAFCDDGQFCNGIETCDPTGGCQAGTPPVCDDGVGCTVDGCDSDADGGAGACAAATDDAACDDGQFCNGVETCDPTNDCQAGEPPVCDDGVECTLDTCDDATGACVSEPDDAFCDDGQFCNGIETCDPTGGCQAGTPPVCDDGVGCTVDSCDSDADGGAGACAAAADDAACDDGQFCNGAETCDPTNDCQAGEAPVCDDGVGCTVDSCDSDADGGAGACVAAADDAACDDGQFCNGVETCDLANDCQAGEPPVCDDGVECTLDTCDDATGACVSEPDDAFCDDGQFCNGIETCDPTGGCQAGEAPVCDDGVGCTVDSCDSDADGGAGACAAAADDAACDDGQFCNGAETCDPTNDCQAGEAPVCDDGVGCTVDSCDSDADGGAGACAAAADDAACDDGQFCNGAETCDPTNDCQAGEAPVCDDGVGCTVDSCDSDADGGAGACVAAADDAACDDGQFCNGVETCDLANDCQAGEPPVCDDGVECTLDTCDDATGACVSEPDDAFCDDGQFCNGIETCDPTGGCQAGEAPVCDDGVGCTVDSCDSDADGGAGACAAAADDAACDDGQFCNGVETCDLANDCQAGEPPVCDDGVECTLDTCDEETGACTSEPDNAFCDDGLFCNGSETCQPDLGCVAGRPPVCDDGGACTTDTCDEEADACAFEADDAFCDDGSFCNGVEICAPFVGDDGDATGIGGGCQAGTPPVCDDGVGCTVDTCDEDADACAFEADDATCDDGQFCNGVETCDPTNDCQAGESPICDDGVGCTVDACDPEANGGAGGCTAVADDAICDDGSFCNGAETCDPANDCQTGEPPVVDDGIDCTIDTCNDETGQVDHLPDDTFCDDGINCTIDTCNPDVGCESSVCMEDGDDDDDDDDDGNRSRKRSESREKASRKGHTLYDAYLREKGTSPSGDSSPTPASPPKAKNDSGR